MNPAFDPLLLSRVEDAGLNASAPSEQRWVDGWLVRYSPAKAKRARCVNAVAHGRGDLRSRIERCDNIFREAGLPAIFRITPFTQPAELDATLAGLGMVRFDDTRVMVLSRLHSETLGMPSRTLPPGVRIQPIDLEAFAHRVGGFRGSAPALRDAQAARMRLSPVPIRAFELRIDGEPAACGQFTREGELAGLYDVFTTAAHRGRGLASHLCRHLLQRAAQDGARQAYLQVEADNSAARAVYHRIGFVDGYAYHYRWHAPSPGSA